MFIVLPLLLALSLPAIASATDIKAPVLPVIAAAVTASVAPVSDVPPSTLVVAVPTSPRPASVWLTGSWTLPSRLPAAWRTL